MPKSKSLRLVIDTNLWISFLISDRQRRLDSLLYLEKIRLLFSTELLDEINATVTKPKLRKYFSAYAMEEMLLTLETYIELIVVKSTVKVLQGHERQFSTSTFKRRQS